MNIKKTISIFMNISLLFILQLACNSTSPVTPIQTAVTNSVTETANPTLPPSVVPRPQEDCVPIDPANFTAEYSAGDIWVVTDGVSDIVGFDQDQAWANESLRMMQFYGFTSQCWVGRPDAVLQYYLIDGKSPAGAYDAEKCVLIDSADFNILSTSSQEQAKLVTSIIQLHGFTHYCHSGPTANPNRFTYFRQ